MTTTTEIRHTAMLQAVERGAYILDQRAPGWPADVNLGRLEMSDCVWCVLGQLFPGGSGPFYGYDRGLSSLHGGTPQENAGWAVDHGFTLRPDIDGNREIKAWEALHVAWVDQIERRLNA